MPLLNGQHTPTDASHLAVRTACASSCGHRDYPNSRSGTRGCRKWPAVPNLRPVPQGKSMEMREKMFVHWRSLDGEI
jgi:hypothetical protein